MPNTAPRRGRPRAGEREERKQRVIAAALDELLQHGYEKVTMLGIASRAGASKETLYNWFGSKEGLFTGLIKTNADLSARRVEEALDVDTSPYDTLVDFATGLLTLLTSPASIALNRAAMSSPELAQVLLANGRHRVGPIVERYLALLSESGEVSIPDPQQAFELLYGLVVRDTQISVLLGEAAPTPELIRQRAGIAVYEFLILAATTPAGATR